ncbi:MAG TPA: hypothetical protein VG406_11890 [Isosphaeraceae bacterium]|jgi:hypothetical protein|nr:hypothetical protein [Isosphaeraceae bacterium]
MRGGRSERGRHTRAAWVAALVVGLGPLPLPKADYHNVRHHDGPGEVCVLHDHLLRWHPGAGVAEDVAVLHWHWIPPAADPTGVPNSDDRPSLRAVSPDWLAPSWDEAPRLAADPSSRWATGLVPDDLAHSYALTAGPLDLDAPIRARAGPRPGIAATAFGRVPRTALLQHWSC